MKDFKYKKLFIFIAIIFVTTITILVYSIIPKNNSTTPPPQDSSISNDSNSPYYDSLYGTWYIANHIPSKMKTTLSDTIISFCIGQNFTIEKDKITSNFATISNPSIDEGVITASDFSKKYNDTFKNLGISGDEIKYIRLTQADNSNHSVTIFIANNEKVYALLKGALFELKKR